MLTLDGRSVVQDASELDVPRQRRDEAYRAISLEPLDAALLEALVRLVTIGRHRRTARSVRLLDR
jgi:hypothetical protein